MKNDLRSKIFTPGFLFAAVFFAAVSINAQTDLAKRQEAYQNQQRAANFNVFRSNIKSVEDAPQRCSLRMPMIRFIFENKVANHYDTADALAIECLDETVDNKDQFSDSNANWWKSNILSLLRRYSPETAKKAEKKYFLEGEGTDLTDYLDVNKDPNGAANRVAAKIAQEGVTNETVGIIGRLREVDREAEFRVLRAAMDYYESHLTEAYITPYLGILSYYYLENEVPVELRRRFHNLIAGMGEAAIADPRNTMLAGRCLEMLKSALPDIKKISAELYPRASAIYQALGSRKSKEEVHREEVLKRIEESKDKLAQALSEAESEQDKGFKNELWQLASDYALEAKKFRIAADSRLKIEIRNSKGEINPVFKRSDYFFLTETLLNACLKENDIESGEYIVKLVEDPEFKSKGLFKIATKLVEMKKLSAAFDKLNEGLKVVEKIESNSTKIWSIRTAIPIALKIDKTRAFDVAAELVKVLNRIPSPGPDDKTGTEARQKYAELLAGTSANLEQVFRQLAKENLTLADVISQGIQLKEWRLAVQIALETERKYPLPEEDATDIPSKP